ncbi:MAG: hypothetical protein ACERKN_18230 [Velocimicrobium sp.]
MEDIGCAKAAVAVTKKQLRQENIRFDETMEKGIRIAEDCKNCEQKKK